MLAAIKEIVKAHKLCQTFNKVFSLTHFLIDEDNEPLKIKGNKKIKKSLSCLIAYHTYIGSIKKVSVACGTV